MTDAATRALMDLINADVEGIATVDNEMTIITNNVPRDVIYGHELGPADRLEFDYVDWDAVDRMETTGSTFVRYKGTLIDLNDTEGRWGTFPAAFAGWDDYISDSFFSGTLFRYVDDMERVIIGRYYT